MTKIIKIIFSLIGPAADTLSILGFLGLSIKNIQFKTIPWYFSLLILLVFLILLKRLVIKIKEIKEIYKDIKVESDLDKISKQTTITDINSALPKTSTLNILFDRLKKRINDWADDAIITSVSLYIDYENNKWRKPSLQVVAYSKWKNEEGWFYEGRAKYEHYEEVIKISESETLSEKSLFFHVNPNWQALVKKSFKAISSKIANQCKICIHNTMDGKRIVINYKEGKVEKNIRFITNDNFDKLSKD
jgi:hypothetical protein